MSMIETCTAPPASAATAAPRTEVEAAMFARLGLIKVAERALREFGPIVTLGLPGGKDVTILSRPSHAAFWHDNPALFFKDTASPGSGVSMTRDVLGKTLLTAQDGVDWAQMRAEITGLLGSSKAWFQRPLAGATRQLISDLLSRPELPLLDHCIAWATRAICEPLFGAAHLDALARDLVHQLNGSFLALMQGETAGHNIHTTYDAVLARIATERGPDSIADQLILNAGPHANADAVNDMLRSVVGGMLAGSLHINALSLFWALAQLAEQPGLQSRLRVEAHPFALTPRRVVDTPLAFATVREAQRLRPVMAFVERQMAADAQLDGYRLRKGQTVLFSPWFAQRSTESWDNPLVFDPMRFLPGARPAKGGYFPFGVGPRICPGTSN